MVSLEALVDSVSEKLSISQQQTQISYKLEELESRRQSSNLRRRQTLLSLQQKHAKEFNTYHKKFVDDVNSVNEGLDFVKQSKATLLHKLNELKQNRNFIYLEKLRKADVIRFLKNIRNCSFDKAWKDLNNASELFKQFNVQDFENVLHELDFAHDRLNEGFESLERIRYQVQSGMKLIKERDEKDSQYGQFSDKNKENLELEKRKGSKLWQLPINRLEDL